MFFLRHTKRKTNHPKIGMSHTGTLGLSHTAIPGLSHTAFGATSAPFANTFPIGNDVAPHDSSSLPLVTLRRCPSRLNDVAPTEDSKERQKSLHRDRL